MLTNICKNIPKEAGNIQYAKFHYFRPTVLGAGTFWFSGFCILSRRSGVGGDARDTKSGQITIIFTKILKTMILKMMLEKAVLMLIQKTIDTFKIRQILLL